MSERALALTGPDTAPAVVEVTVPPPGPGEVTVTIEAGTFNGIDGAIVAGYLWGMPHEFPVALGRDLAGTVSAVGEGVDDLAVGDRVAGVIEGMTLGPGTVGSALTIAAERLARVPEGVAPEAAASVGLAGCTAVDVVAALDAQPGSTILVSGATGGVGAFVVQLLITAGAKVLATARDEEAVTFARDLGATATVWYDALTDLEPVDAVAHLAGDPAALARLIRPGGSLVSVLGADQPALGRDDVTAVPVMATTEAAKVAGLLAKVGDGDLRVPVTTYPLDQAVEAFASFTGHKLGKVAVTSA